MTVQWLRLPSRFQDALPRRARTRTRSRAALLALLGVLALGVGTGCPGVVYGEPGRYPDHDHEHDEIYEEGYGHPVCRVPPGHLPPPGSCRLWYPGRPPGQQPPPGDCEELLHHAPHGACIVYGG